jgi:hypothetical protein
MIRFRKGKEEHVVSEAERERYEGDGWKIVEEGVGSPRTPNAKRNGGKWERDEREAALDQWRGRSPEENLQALKDEIEALRQRLDKLEG